VTVEGAARSNIVSPVPCAAASTSASFLNHTRKRNSRLDDLIARTQVLVEALPYIKRFRGKTFVVKYGGHAMLTPELRSAFCQDIVLLDSVGIRPVVVHGGGPQITELITKLGLKSRFVRGMRVTDEATMEAAEMVLQRLNKEIAALISRHGGSAVGLSGKDSELIVSRQMRMILKGENGKRQPVDVGLVGDIEMVNPAVLTTLRDAGFIPIIAPIGLGRDGQTYNINADVAAGKIAAALAAEKLILLTDVEGVKDEHGQLISVLDASRAHKMIGAGAIAEGMIPKVECCIDALRAGVAATHIIDGRLTHSVLLEILTDSGIGTEVRRRRVHPKSATETSGA
jgi:acetylglutamate kinase